MAYSTGVGRNAGNLKSVCPSQVTGDDDDYRDAMFTWIRKRICFDDENNFYLNLQHFLIGDSNFDSNFQFCGHLWVQLRLRL